VAELAQHPIPSVRWWHRTQATTPEGASNTAPLSSVTWTAQHVKVAAWLMENPTISTREIARRLFPNTDGGGDYSTRAKAVRLLAEEVLGDELLAVRTPNNTPVEAPTNGLTA
jgi:hypothetical protein